MGKTSKIDPWERQPGETEKAFEAFVIYRDAGADRSVRQVGQKLGKSRALIEKWSRKWNWVERAAAYDNEIDRQSRMEREKLASDIRKRQLKIAAVLEQKALDTLKDAKSDAISVRDAKELLKLAVDIEHRTLLDKESGNNPEDTSSSLANSIISAWQKRME